MHTIPRLRRRDIGALAECIVTLTAPAFQKIDQEPIVRIVAHKDAMRRLQKALRRRFHGNVQFCIVSPRQALVVVATFTVDLLACSHCHSPYEEGHVTLSIERNGRSLPLKETAKVWICRKCGIEDAPMLQAEPEPQEPDILDEPLPPLEPATLPLLAAPTPVTEPEPVAREIAPTMRNADVAGIAHTAYRGPRTHPPKIPKSRPRTARCPGFIIGQDRKEHPCRHNLTDRIAHGSARGGQIIDRANDGPRQTKLAKQGHIDSQEPSKSFVPDSPEERAEKLAARAEAARERAFALTPLPTLADEASVSEAPRAAIFSKREQLAKLQAVQKLLAATGHIKAAETLQSKRIDPLLRDIGRVP